MKKTKKLLTTGERRNATTTHINIYICASDKFFCGDPKLQNVFNIYNFFIYVFFNQLNFNIMETLFIELVNIEISNYKKISKCMLSNTIQYFADMEPFKIKRIEYWHTLCHNNGIRYTI